MSRIPAGEMEKAVIGQLRVLIRAPELVTRTWSVIRDEYDEAVPERDVQEALAQFEAVWDELFPAEQARIVHLLIHRIDVQPDGIEVKLRLDGLKSLIAELKPRDETAEQDEAA